MAEPVSAVVGVAEAMLAWARQERGRMSERASGNMNALLHEIGFVTHDEFEEMELRVAQLEHRLRLLESAPPPVTLAGDGTTGDEEPRPAL